MRRNRAWTGKKGGKSHLGYKLHNIIDKDYEYIKRFKTTLASLSDSHVNFSEKNEMVYRYRGYFGTKSRNYDTTMKKQYKNILWEWVRFKKTRVSAQEKLHGNEFMPELKRYSKKEKFLSRLLKSKSKDVV